MIPLGRHAVGLGALALTLTGCGGNGSKAPPTSPAATTPVTAAPMTPTDSGSALEETYGQRCAASLSGKGPARAKGKGTLREMRLRSPDSSHTLRSIFVYRPGGLRDTAKLPVVYVLHGLPGDPAAIWTQSHAAGLLDTEFARGAVPYEVVTLDGRGAKHRDTEWAPEARRLAGQGSSGGRATLSCTGATRV